MGSDMIQMQSGVSAYTGEPYVELRWGNETGQLTPEELRAHAYALLECADAAVSDAFLYRFAKLNVGASEESAARLLMAFREYREGKQPPREIPKAEQ